MGVLENPQSVSWCLRSRKSKPDSRGEPESAALEFEIVDQLKVNGQTFVSWQEAMEREVTASQLCLLTPSSHRTFFFEFPAGRELEPLCNNAGQIEGVVIREWKTLCGFVETLSEQLQGGVIKVTVGICNLTANELPREQSRADALMDSLVSAHTILSAENGQFVSLLDPPDELKDLATKCSNVGTWPVLVGEEGERHTMLSSPIILYDYPQIAPESPGGLFDGTEIDEILSLRILTMTEEEKREMRQSDERTRQILERTESMPPEQFMKLHGALRGLHPVTKEAQ